jgi:hypothetical protein
MEKAIINWWEIKWSENGIVKRNRFDTQSELDTFIKAESKKTNFKYIGKSRDVIYPDGFDCYNGAELEKMEYVEKAVI